MRVDFSVFLMLDFFVFCGKLSSLFLGVYFKFAIVSVNLVPSVPVDSRPDGFVLSILPPWFFALAFAFAFPQKRFSPCYLRVSVPPW
jgi:hypothetical protein